MTVVSPDDAEVQNQQSLKKLKRAIAFSQGRFSLILVRCNYTCLRERILEDLLSSDIGVQGNKSPRIQTLVLPKSAKTLYSTIQAELSSQQPEALMVLGLESVTALDDLLICANQVRDEFRRGFGFPLVLWVNDQVLKKLVKLARDFHSWAGVPIKFSLATDQLIEVLQQTSDQLFSKVLEVGADRFIDNSALNLGMGAAKRFELESALKELQNRGHNLPALEASQQFILGRDAYANNQLEQAQQLYEQSLTFWQQNHNLERIACLLLHLGLLWRKYAMLHRTESKIANGRARAYYYQCVEILQQANRPDLAARFINALAGVLHELENWQELETVAKAAIELHQTYPNSLRLAYAYGFLAEVALAKAQWSQAKQYAKTALEIHAQLPDSSNAPHNQVIHFGWVRQHYRSWYRFLLAEAQRHLEQKSKAFQNLETARVECLHEYNPMLYLRILEELRSLHYQQGEYLEAFNYKQEKRQIQQEYGFRAFIGAGRLQAQRQVIHPTLVGVETSLDSNADSPQLSQTIIAQEIVASGRKKNVDYLIERMTRNDQKLIVIHGLSGVGKSSILTAGLVPALRQVTTIDGRIFLSVVVRTYTNWVGGLGKALQKSLGIVKDIRLSETPNSLEMIVEQLRKNITRNLLTVIIFDQFEEFFFNCPKPVDRHSFWAFLHVCLDSLELPYVKVILSLREDYLHYLLECDRLRILEITRNDILNQEIRYPFGNFSTEEAIAVIQCLTQRSLYLDPALIEQLVQDLAADLGEVRPIELQIVGAQLQADKITTLEQYQQYGSKEKLVEEFLEAVIEDCGRENERAARLVLYLLTDENNTRPPKTRADLEADLAEEADKLNLVLEIFVKSGLVFVLPQHPADRYQLVHDYLVSFIRQQQGEELLAELAELRNRAEQNKVEIEQLRREKELLEELAKEQDQRKLTEEELKRAEQSNRILAEAQQKARRKMRRGSVILSICLAVATTAGFFAVIASQKLAEIQKSTEFEQAATNYWQQFKSGQEIDALVSAIGYGKSFKIFVGKARPLEKYPTTSPLLVLQKILDNIHQQNQFNANQEKVNSVSFSRDGKLVASASDDGTARLWDLSGKQLVEFKGHQKPVNSLSFSSDGKRIVTGSSDGTARLWDLSGKQIAEFKDNQGEVYSVSFSPNGQYLATAGEDGITRLWNLSGKLLVKFKKHPALIKSVSFSPNGQYLATAGDKGTVRLWNLKGEMRQEFIGHQDQCRVIGKRDCRIRSVSFSPDGKQIVTGGYDRTVRLWNLKGKQLQRFDSTQGAVLSVSFSPNGKLIATTGDKGTTQLRNIETGELQRELVGNIQGNKKLVLSASFSRDGKHLVTGESAGTIRLWNLNDTQQTKFRTNLNSDVNTIVSSVSFSPNGQRLVTSAIEGDSPKEEGPVRLWNLKGEMLQEFKDHSRGALDIDFSRNGQLLATAGEDRTARLWNLKGEMVQELIGHKEGVRSVRFSPDGKLIATASKDGHVRLWNLKGQPQAKFIGHTKEVRSVRFSPDGKLIATAAEDGYVRLWKREGQPQGSSKYIKDGFMSMNFSPDGQRLVTGGYDGHVRLWNLKGDQIKEIKSFDSYQEWVMSVSFSPDGQRLATGGQDKSVRLWNLNGQQIAEFTGHEDKVWSVSFSLDGQRLATSSEDGTVRLWRVENLDQLLSRGCNWVRDYLKNNSNAKESDRTLCDDIPNSK